jgi:hypothetical protein
MSVSTREGYRQPAKAPFPELGVWARQAACRDEDPDLFFLDEAEVTDTIDVHLRQLCASCPVLADCRRYVDWELERSSDGSPTSPGSWHGFWAGEWPWDRRVRRRIRASDDRSLCCGHGRLTHDMGGPCLARRCRCEEFEAA